jgi:integrase
MAKRAQGEGSVYRRKDGRWVASISVGLVNGRPRRKNIYGATQKEVLQQLSAYRNLQRQGVNIAPERIKLRDWLNRWLECQTPPALRPKSYTAYEYQIRKHLAPDLGDILITRLQPRDVREFMAKKLKAGLAAKTVRHLRATLRAALNVALTDGLVHRNAAALAKPPRLDERTLKVFDRAEALRFIDVVKGHRLEALFTVTLSTGVREGEILGLQWDDIDFAAGTLKINHGLQRVKMPGEVKSSLRLVNPKSTSSRRTISLPQIAVSALIEHRRVQQEERMLCGSAWKETGMVFTTSVGTPLDQRTMLRRFYAILHAADLPRIRFHDLRHSAATLLLAQGVHPRFIMELLGHSSISLTMNTYGHVLEEMKKETAKQMDAVFEPVAVKVAVKRQATKVN